jgi:small-conductance mechanosensitive channel
MISVLAFKLFGGISAGTHRVLFYSFFKVGALAITPVFLLKATIFVTLLVVVSHWVQKLVLSRLFRYVNLSDAAKFAFGRFATYLLFLGGLLVGVQSLGVNLSSLVVFGGAVGVGVGLGLQNVVSNFVAGLILLIEQPIRIGDRVEMKDTLGDVVRIAARSTWIRTNDNVVIIVPNSDFINNSVTNWTANDPNVRISIPVGVGYNSDPEQVREILLAAADANPKCLKLDSMPTTVLFTDYGDNSLDFVLRVWTADAHTPALLKSELYFDLFKRFTAAGIELPFPQRDLHIRSSDIALPFPGPAAKVPDASTSAADSTANDKAAHA